jgi:hypothetical protein
MVRTCTEYGHFAFRHTSSIKNLPGAEYTEQLSAYSNTQVLNFFEYLSMIIKKELKNSQ